MRILTLIAGAAIAGPARAQAYPVADSGDNAWVMAASLVVLATGVAGAIATTARGRDARSLVAIFAALAAVLILFVVAGYSLAFGGGTVIGDTANLFLANLSALRIDTTISEAVHVGFISAALVVAAALLAGMLAQRAPLGWMIGFVPVWSLLVAVPVLHWLWGGGWLSARGAIDTGGGLSLLLPAGVAMLAVGPFLARAPTGTALATTDAGVGRLAGAGLLWLAITALNGGSGLGAADVAAGAMLNVQLGGAAGLLGAFTLDHFRSSRAAPVDSAVAGLLAGMAAVSVGGAYVGVAGALILGLVGVAGAALIVAATRAGRDGNGGTIAAALAGGAGAGALGWPVFALPALGGPGYDASITMAAQWGMQAIAVAAVGGWAALVSVIAALMVSVVRPMQPEPASPDA